jgi:hypothetical protein
MSTLNIVAAGLVALIRRSDRAAASAALLTHTHQHFPILLVPKTSDLGGLPTIPEGELRDRLRDAPSIDTGSYYGIDMDQLNAAIEGTPVDVDLTFNDASIGECPEDGDWTSLRWVLCLNTAHGYGPFAWDKKKRLSEHPEVRTLLPWTFGHLRGHKPVERVTVTRTYCYQKYERQAFADAFEWSAAFSSDCVLVLTRRADGSEKGRVQLPPSAQLYLLNLSNPAKVHAVDDFKGSGELPYPGSQPVKEPKPVGRCGQLDRSEPGDPTTTALEGSSEISVSVTAKGPRATALNVTVTVATTKDIGQEQAPTRNRTPDGEQPMFDGDSLCMARQLTVDEF